MTTPTLAQLQADAAAISVKSPAIRQFALDTVAYLQAQAQAAQPSASAGVGALDDQRAIHMTAISASGMAVDAAGVPTATDTTIRSQTPAGFWTGGLLYTNNDVSLISDARFGQVYRFRTNGQSHNPYWSTPTVCNTTLVQKRPITIGQWDWYALAIKWEPTWDYASVVNWHVLFQCAYPTISSPPLAVAAGYGDHIFVQRYAGAVDPTTALAAERQDYQVEAQSSVQGKWYEVVVGVKWGAHSDGEIHYLSRCKDNGQTAFTELVTETALNTWQWGGALNVPQDPQAFGVVDKLDSYYGYVAGQTDATVPTNYVQHTGHVRCQTKDAALSYFP